MKRLLMVTSLVLTACGGDAGSPGKTPAPAETSKNEKAGEATPAKAGEPAVKENVVAPYVAIQELLADDSVADLAQIAARVVTAAESIQDQAGIGDVVAGAGRVASPDIETARVGFEKMSMGLITYLKAHPAEQEGYEVCHCPMAFNNKGAYWVQKKGEILNPYHGKMMLRCGDHVEWAKAPG